MPKGKRVDPYRGFRFRVKIPGFEYAGFSKVSGIKEETAKVEYREGEDPPIRRQLDGMTTYDNVVFERGEGPVEDLKKWRRDVYNPDGAQTPEENMRRQVVVELLDKGGSAVKKWLVNNAWPTILTTSDLDAASDDPVIKTLELANEGVFEII